MKARTILILLPVLAAGILLLVFWRAGRHAEGVPTVAAPPVDAQRTETVAQLETVHAERALAPGAASTPVVAVAEEVLLATNEAELRVLVITAVKHEPLARRPLFLWRRVGGQWPDEWIDDWRAREGQVPRTNDAGCASFVVTAPGDFELYVDPEELRLGRVQVSVSKVEIGERRDVNIEVWSEDDVHFFGRVSALEGGQPIAGASIELCDGDVIWTEEGRNVERSTVRCSTRSGPDGLFELRSSSWSDDFARVEAPGYSQLRFVPTVGHDTPESALPIALARSAAVRAHVSDSIGKPLVDVEVHVRAERHRITLTEGGETRRLGGDLDRHGVTARDGTAVIEDLPAHVPLAVALEQDGKTLRRRAAAFELEPGEIRDVDLRIGAGISLGGIVIDQNEEPVASAHLWLLAGGGGRVLLDPWNLRDLTAEAITNAEGRFLFEDVSPGTYQLAPSPGGWGGDSSAQGLAAVAQEIEVAAAPPDQEVTLRVRRGLYLRGRVQGPDGKGVERAWVRARGVDGAGEVGARCDEDGSFAAGGLVPGRYSLTAGGFGRADAFAYSEPVIAEAGQEGVLLLVRRGAAILGRVVNERGELRVAELSIRSTGRMAELHPDMRWPTNGGRFEIGGLDAGIFRVCATTRDPAFAFERVELKDGQRLEDLVLELSPGARIELCLEGSRKRVLVEVSHPSGFETSAAVQGEASITLVVPPGEVTLVCSGSSPGQKLSRTVTAKLGETARVSIRWF